MTSNDTLGVALFCGFGLWWIVAPRSVTTFYTWFARGKAKIPRLIAIGLIGAAWFILVVAVFILGRKK